jgi:hypothetical protein
MADKNRQIRSLDWISIAGFEDPPFANVTVDADGRVNTDTPGVLGLLGRAFVAHRQTHTTFDRKAETIKMDPDLSPQGRVSRLRQLANETLASLDKVDAVVNVADAREKLTKRLTITTDGGDPATQAIRRMEIRNWMRGMDPLQLQVEIEEAANAGDISLLDALVSAPSYLVPKLNAEVLDRARNTLGEKRDPLTAAELRTLNEADDIYQSARTSLRNHIANEGGLTAEPRIL